MPKQNRRSIVQQIQKLLRLGKGAGEEADAARKLADKLRQRHGVDDDELADDESAPSEIVIHSRKWKTSWRMILWKVVTMPLGVALLRRTDEAGGGMRVILKGRRDTCLESKHAYTYFSRIAEELAGREPEATNDLEWRRDFCRGIAECLRHRWSVHIKGGNLGMGSPPPAAPPPPPMSGPSETITIEPVRNRIARHVGMQRGNDIPMPPRRKRKKKKKVASVVRALPPIQVA
jgi:hypothetical protein